MDWSFSTTARDAIANATARQNIWHGSVRSGKTVSSLVAWVLWVTRDAPPGPLVMIGKTEDTLERNILLPMQEAFGQLVHYSKGRHRAWIGHREVYLIGANDARAEGRIRGATFAGAYGDELTLWPEAFYRQLLARLSVAGARLFGTTNPDGPYHWLKASFIDREADLDLRAFPFRLEDNVALDPEYVAALKAEYGEGSLWYRRFILGQWVAAEGAVYDFFDEREHVLDEPPAASPDHVDLAVDYGTSNATSVGAYGTWRHAPEGAPRAVRFDGWYYDGRATGRQKTDREYAGEIREWVSTLDRSVRYVFVDPSAASFMQELRRHGMRVRPAKNDVVDGIRTQAKMLRSGEYRLLRTRGNQQAIEDYGAYLWDSKAQERGEDKPLKQNDHTKDEERYFLHTMFGGITTDRRTAELAYR